MISKKKYEKLLMVWLRCRRVTRDGNIYIKFKRQFFKESRVVYQLHHPDEDISGFDIHHKDVNRANNHPSNLQKISNIDHIKLHNKEQLISAARRLSKNIKNLVLRELLDGIPAGIITKRYNVTRTEVTSVLLYHNRNVQEVSHVG